MGLVTFSLFHLFFSIETSDEERTIFSSELLENPMLLKTSALSLLTIFLATTFGPLQRVLDTVELDHRAVGAVRRRRRIDHRHRRSPQVLPPEERHRRGGEPATGAGRPGVVTDRATGRAPMTVIIPRWEWRTFGQHFGAAEAAFAALTPSPVHESDELYLLPADAESAADSVKIRDDLMDVKTLREVAASGLERWEPVLKVGFPLAAADVERVCDGAPPGAAGERRRRLHARAVPRGGRHAERRRPPGPRPQVTGPIHGQRLHGRALGRRRRRAGHADGRHRIDGRGRGGRGHPSRWGSTATSTRATRAASRL